MIRMLAVLACLTVFPAIAQAADCANISGGDHTSNGGDNTVGLHNGDSRFLCQSAQWNSCWNSGSVVGTVERAQDEAINGWTCDRRHERWVPPLNPASCYFPNDQTWGQSNSGHLPPPNNDTRFMCMNGRWYSCGWNTNEPWQSRVTGGFVVGTWQCSGSAWVAHGPLYSPNAVTAMTNIQGSSYAYGFSSTYIPGIGDIGVFDADSLLQSSASCSPAPQCQMAPDRSVGDSIGVKYGSALNFGTHYRGSDLAVTRSSTSFANAADHEDPNNWNSRVIRWQGDSPYMNGGASNGQLIQIGVNWVFYWLVEKQDPQNLWRHYMMMSYFNNSSIGNIFAAEMRTLRIMDGYGPATVGLNNQPVIDAGPVYEDPGDRVVNTYATAEAENTGGLIGNITTGADNSTVYFYSTDGTYDANTQRPSEVRLDRRTVNTQYLTHMSAPDVVFRNAHSLPNAIGYIPVIEVNYHKDKNQYIALYYCKHPVSTLPNSPTKYDLCVRRFSDAALTLAVDGGPALSTATFDTISNSEAATFGLGLQDDPSISNQELSQFGVRKNALGQLFTDANGDIIVYFSVGDGLFGNTYAKRIRLD